MSQLVLRLCFFRPFRHLMWNSRKKSFQFDVLGGNVNTAFNICDKTEPNEILISNEAWMSVRSEVEVQSKGLMKLKSDNQIEVLELLSINN